MNMFLCGKTRQSSLFCPCQLQYKHFSREVTSLSLVTALYLRILLKIKLISY